MSVTSRPDAHAQVNVFLNLPNGVLFVEPTQSKEFSHQNDLLNPHYIVLLLFFFYGRPHILLIIIDRLLLWWIHPCDCTIQLVFLLNFSCDPSASIIRYGTTTRIHYSALRNRGYKNWGCTCCSNPAGNLTNRWYVLWYEKFPIAHINTCTLHYSVITLQFIRCLKRCKLIAWNQ